MIDAGDLTTAEVRSAYVLPLVGEILEKSGAVNDIATALGVDIVDVAAPSTSATSASEETREVKTLFQEIATEKNTNGRSITGCAAPRCYAELLEEAAALCAYTSPQENAIIATVASSSLLAFLAPHCHFQGFLRSYYVSPTKNYLFQSNTATNMNSLDERLLTAMLPNHRSVFPQVANRSGSVVVDNDCFTSPSFHNFLVQGLGPYLSCGVAFNFSSRDTGPRESDDSEESQCDKILFQAATDLIQLLALAICPNSPIENALPSSLSMEGDKSAGGEQALAEGIMQLANSTIPLSFQLSYSDRLQIVKLCNQLFLADRDDASFSFDSGTVVEMKPDNGDGSTKNSAGNGNDVTSNDAFDQLRSALFGFASYNAHTDEDAVAGYRALANVSVVEGETSSIQFEFQRLLKVAVETTSESCAVAISDILADMITRYNGSRYYADPQFTRFSLGVVGECIGEKMRMCMADEDGELTDGSVYKVLTNEDSSKRQRLISATRKNKCKPCHFIALVKVARPLFHFLLNNTGEAKDEQDCNDGQKRAERDAKYQLMKDVTLFLCYPASLSVVRSASQTLALGLSYNRDYITNKSNVRHLFRFTRQALNASSGSAEVAKALRPLLITASRQSRTFAESLVSYAVKNHSDNEMMKWKIASIVSFACPAAVFHRLTDLQGSSEDSEVETAFGDNKRDEVMTFLSCSMASITTNMTSQTIQRCHSIARNVTDQWTLFKIVRNAFITGNFGFANQIFGQRQLIQACSRQQSFLWMTILSKIAHGEDILGIKGGVGLSKSLEALNACHSTLQSLAAIEQDGLTGRCYTLDLRKFGFQLEFIRLRIDYLKLCMVARSLCSEIILTGGSISARTKLVARNIPKSFGMLASQYIDAYRLYGSHYCQQTRSALRTLIAMCQYARGGVEAMLLPKPNPKEGEGEEAVDEASASYAKADLRYPMGLLIKKYHDESRDLKSSRAPEFMDLLDNLLRCPIPFPPGFFTVKEIPSCCANLSADTSLLPTKHEPVEKKAEKSIVIKPGLPFKLVVSGAVPEWQSSAQVQFHQIVCWKTYHWEGTLYEEEDADDTETGNEMRYFPIPTNDPYTASLQPGGEFNITITCEPIIRDGFYRVDVKLGCRDVQCNEWMIPVIKPLELSLRVEDYGNE